MILVYTILNIFFIYYGKKCYRKWFNPVSVYSLVWEFAVLAHEIGLIVFYEMTVFTWLVIIGAQIIFILGCQFGQRIKQSYNSYIVIDENVQKEMIKKYILFTMLIASVSILYTTYQAISMYGTNLFININSIYANRVDQGVTVQSIPYIGSFIYITVALAGIHLKRYGFTKFVIPAFVLAFLSALTSGGRAGIVFVIMIFISAYFLTNGPNRGLQTLKRLNKRTKIVLLICVAVLGYMVISISEQRVKGGSIVYATKLYKIIFGNNILIYKMLSYIAAPIGALNEYLRTCEFHFGKNTFLTIYNILEKLGVGERVAQYQKGFSTPLRCNVGTWLRELIEDFTLPVALFAVFLFAAILTKFYVSTRLEGGIKNKIVASILMMIILLSFFDWRLRNASTWIILILGYFIGKKIDNKSIGEKDG